MKKNIPRAEATLRARQTDRFALEVFRVLQDFHVEHVYLQHGVAGIAAPSSSVALALDAIFRVGFEVLWELLHVARGARMATNASENPISSLSCRFLPLRYRRFLFPEPFAAY